MFITLGKELQKGFCEYLGPTSGRAQIPRTAALLVLTKYWSGIDKFEHIRLVPVLGGFLHIQLILVLGTLLKLSYQSLVQYWVYD